MKCWLCSSGLYICMIRFLSRSACSSLVNLSALLKPRAMKQVVAISNSLRGCLFMERLRVGTDFLSGCFYAALVIESKHRYDADFGRSRARFLLLFRACDWCSLFWSPWLFSHLLKVKPVRIPNVT